MKTRNFIESAKSFCIKINKIIIREQNILHPKRGEIFLKTDIKEYWTELENIAGNMHQWQVMDFDFDIHTQTLTIYV